MFVDYANFSRVPICIINIFCAGGFITNEKGVHILSKQNYKENTNVVQCKTINWQYLRFTHIIGY